MNNEFFYCYSPKLKQRLLDAGERFICVGLNEKADRRFWLFKQNSNLSAVLTDWHRNKPAAE